ncbi:MAG: hypothetical protein RL213_820 [Bacteroidota bacterium]|jgi:hypothetical protein
MKTSNNLRLGNAATLAAFIAITLMSCSKEEAVLPMEQGSLSVTEKTSDNDRESRMIGSEPALDINAGKMKEPVRDDLKDRIYLNNGQRQLAFEDDGARQERAIQNTVREKEISVHYSKGLDLYIEPKAELIDRKELLGYDRAFDRSGITEKTHIHDALDFTPARSEFKETGARLD